MAIYSIIHIRIPALKSPRHNQMMCCYNDDIEHSRTMHEFDLLVSIENTSFTLFGNHTETL